MAAGLASEALFGIGILLATSFFVGELFERIGIESIIGYIVTGLLLGPSFLHLIKPGTVQAFATIGATLILFQAGLREENVVEIFKHKEGLQLGLGILLGSFVFTLISLILIGNQILPFTELSQFLLLALAYSVVDIGVPSKIMLSRGMLEEPTGRYSIKAAVINVTAGLLVLTGIVLLNASGEQMIVKIAGIAGFILIFFLLHEFIHKVDNYIVMFEEAESQFAITISLLLILSYMTEIIGLSAVLGAFFAGIVVSRSEFSESRAFQEKIQAIGLGLFIPLFFAWFGLSLHIMKMIKYWQSAAFLFLLSTTSKITIGYLVSKKHKMEHPLTIGASMISLDIETLVILLIGISMGLFTKTVLQIFAPAVFLSTLTIVMIFLIIDKREK